MIRTAILAALLLAAPARAALQAAPTAVPGVRYRHDRIILRLAPDAAVQVDTRVVRGATPRLAVPAIDRVAARLGVRGFAPAFTGRLAGPLADLRSFWAADLPPGVDPRAAAAAFAALPDVASAEPVAIVPVSGFPDDSLWDVSAHLYQLSRHDVHAPEAWDLTRGDTSIVLAVLDTGVLHDHPDLAGQLWWNAAERDGLPGVDDDGNGYVDDVQGWDFVALPTADDVRPLEDWRDEDPDPNDFAGHGTAVSGVAAAHTNNRIGIAGMAPDIRIMPLRVGWSAQDFPIGLVDLSFAAKAIAYAVANGASVVNCSFGSTADHYFLAAIEDAVRAGVTVVFSSGNNGSPAAAAQLPEVVSVAATGPTDVIAPFSNLLPMVALSAPGLNIPATTLTHAGGDSLTDRQPSYTTGASGTSFSAPIVAATAALLQSRRRAQGLPPLAPIDVKLRLMETTDPIENLNPGVSGYGTGRLNAGRALTEGPRSFHLHAAGRSVGPALVIPALRGEARLAFALDTGEIVFIGGRSGETLGRITLPAPPVGMMAAADPGTGLGTVIYVPCADRKIHAYDLLGNPVPGWPVAATSISDPVRIGPELGDLDGDGVPELTWGGDDGRVYAWHADGTSVDGFPRGVASPGPNLKLAVADLGGTPGADIVAAAASGTIIAIDGSGATLPGWPRQHLFPAADVIVVTGAQGVGPEVVAAGGSLITAWDAGGALVFSHTLPVYAVDGLAEADLDGDGRSEIVVPMVDRITAIDGSGTYLPGFPRTTDGLVAGPPVVGGVTWLSPTGITLGCDNGVGGYGLRAFSSTGSRAARFPLPGDAGEFPVLGDVDGDGATEIVAGSGSDGSLWIYDAGENTWRAPEWPTAGGNPARTHSRIGVPALTPYDDVAPPPVTDLEAARAAPTRVDLHWTGVPDEGPQGAPVRYEAAASSRPFTAAEFETRPVRGVVDAAGASMEIKLDGLPAGTDYYFAVRSTDASGNVSPLSNLATVLQSTPLLARGVRLIPVRNPARGAVELGWFAAADVAAGPRTIRIFDVSGRLLARYGVGPGYEGVTPWDGRDRYGRRVPPGLYFARFEAPGYSARARFALVR